MVSDRGNGGNWGVFSALAGLAIVAIAIVLLVKDLSAVDLSYSHSAANASIKYQSDAQAYIKENCIPTATVLREKDCAAKAEEAAREGQRKEQDLAAQNITAWWTKIMGIAALIGMALSVVGVWLVKATFDAARNANAIAIASQRAWIKSEIRPLSIEPIDADYIKIWLEITIKNVGQMAARSISAKILAIPQSAERRRAKDLRKPSAIPNVVGALPPNSDETFKIFVEFPAKEISSLGTLKRYRAIITLTISYADGETIETWLVGERKGGDDAGGSPWEISLRSSLTENGIAWRPYTGRSYT